MKKLNKLSVEDGFAKLIQIEGLPNPVRQFHVYPLTALLSKKPRRLVPWRYDFAWPERKLLVDVQGGVFIRGRHVRGAGYERDCRKHSHAVLQGYSVLTVTSSMVRSHEAMRILSEALGVGNPSTLLE